MDTNKHELQKALRSDAGRRKRGGKKRFDFAVAGPGGMVSRSMMRRRFRLMSAKV